MDDAHDKPLTYYGTDIEFEWAPTELESYQDWVRQHTSTKVPKETRLMWSLAGLQAGVGEVSAVAEKFLRHEGWIDYGVPQWKDELGDVLWYFAAVCNELVLSIDEVLDYNVEKINARVYGDATKED